MSMPYTAASSNWFRVKDIEAFAKDLSGYDINIEVISDKGDERKDGTTLVQLFVEDGYWPADYYDESNNLVEHDIIDVIAPHLTKDSVALLYHVGFERSELWGGVEGVNHKGETAYEELETMAIRIETFLSGTA